jgi:hypothetical protein
MYCVAAPAISNVPNYDSSRLFNLATAAPTQPTFPWYGHPQYGNQVVSLGVYTDGTGALFGDMNIALQQHNMGQISFYNLSPNARLTMKVRWGVELRVEPVSVLGPALQPSASHDTLALLAYSDVAGSLPWAFPSSYNADGKILDVIKKIWNNVKPVLGSTLSLIPHPAAQAAGMFVNRLPTFERPAGTGTSVAVSPTPRVPKMIATTRTTRRVRVRKSARKKSD